MLEKNSHFWLSVSLKCQRKEDSSQVNGTEAWAAGVAVDRDCAKSATITQMAVQLLDYGKYEKSSSQHVNSVHPFSRFEK